MIYRRAKQSKQNQHSSPSPPRRGALHTASADETSLARSSWRKNFTALFLISVACPRHKTWFVVPVIWLRPYTPTSIQFREVSQDSSVKHKLLIFVFLTSLSGAGERRRKRKSWGDTSQCQMRSIGGAKHKHVLFMPKSGDANFLIKKNKLYWPY